MIKMTLDVREFEHPKPLELAMKALRELDERNYLYMIHRKNPVPLLDFAAEQNFQCLSQEDTKGDWHILIAKHQEIDLTAFLDGSFGV